MREREGGREREVGERRREGGREAADVDTTWAGGREGWDRLGKTLKGWDRWGYLPYYLIIKPNYNMKYRWE